MKRLHFLLSSLAVVTSSPVSADEPAARPYWRTIVRGTHGMVAAEHPLQAMAGLDALKAGGNAVDAALAVFYMTAVVEQHQAGLGGDWFVLAYIAKEHRGGFFNGPRPAPTVAAPDRYWKLGHI